MNSFQGYIQVYTGDGKGKTTAALGLVLRAIGAGYKVLFCQFLKLGEFSEIKALKKNFPDNVTILQFGSGKFVKGKVDPKDRERVENGLIQIKTMALQEEYRVIVLDEINVAISLGLVEVKEVLNLIKCCGKDKEWILTGRNAPPALIDAADLVTEMRKVKHYFDKGVRARLGIEK